MNLHHGGDFYYVILSFSFFAERALACRYDLASVLSRCSFRMASVCACLYGFASALSHSLFVGDGACPSRCTLHCHFLNPRQPRSIPRKALNLPFNERSVGFASLRNSGRSTSGIHARPRKRVRSCCSVKPIQLWWGLKLIAPLSSKLLSYCNPLCHGNESVFYQFSNFTYIKNSFQKRCTVP